MTDLTDLLPIPVIAQPGPIVVPELRLPCDESPRPANEEVSYMSSSCGGIGAGQRCLPRKDSFLLIARAQFLIY
ncbi:hypothetical protein PC129_g14769 [Phytophthora cactorum]|uniref:Uncharacterized protein n=1 Tax=Phytophthora cactorum TaxID=29920 RepID=A0A8T1LIA9_9STRA|nr:hypothetical protein Pcac1_g24088 [Phytophthora cactorum]KAG2931734.1 hypothetical protein PC114_g2078 [Phytophthora cactorum]KAG3214305.1 hypothetical protein PC129_g14769 [Phytophthora cactorum]KAG4248540.1 hypothetical protein PC116_g3769 [Phytophthora cactorum]